MFSDGLGSGSGILRPRRTGSRVFGTSMTNRMLCRSRPDTFPASLPAQFVGTVRMLLHPLPDLLHRHLLFRDEAAIDQDAAHRCIWIAVMRVVIDAERRAILDPHSRRALDLREQQISLILQPADFE